MLSRITAKKTQPALPSRKSRAGMRLGATTTEAVISAVLLGLTVAAVGKFANITRDGLRERELSARIDWELVNAREQIGSWAPSEVTEANIEAIAFSASVQQHFEELAWEAGVEEIEDPIPALQVQLSLTAKRKSQSIRPAELTFWVPLEVAAVSDTIEPVEEDAESVETDLDESKPVLDADSDESTSRENGGDG